MYEILRFKEMRALDQEHMLYVSMSGLVGSYELIP